MGGFREKIDMHDTAGAALGCAHCGAIVRSGESHTCKGEVSNGDKPTESKVAEEGDSAA